ncbi:RraA family protein [Aggregatilinea lenta]|uniref:RraA family protein n=1 Tax=Aggregatilinea lenta TaxID=913108 RepID=UPI000E5A9D08|nr:RraA family protein [Aggregatilinea lenta]
MNLWTSDEELFDLARRELFTAVVGDVMDKMGLLHQFLPPHLKPLHPDMVVIGRAMPVLEADVFAETSADSANPVMGQAFGLMFRALDDLRPHEVYVCTGASPRYALWGGLMSTRAIHLKAAGAVVDGYSRDTDQILALDFPTFSAGGYAQDQGSRGKVIDFRVPIEIGGTLVRPGDILYGDRDGVCVIPREAEEEAFRGALEKARGEQRVKQAIESGMSATDAFAHFGIM